MAAVLFLVPITTVVGAWLLLLVFAGAILLHVLHGQYEVGGLLVYSAAVYVVLAFRDSRRLRIDENISRVSSDVRSRVYRPLRELHATG